MQCFICMTYIVVAWCSTGGARFLLRDTKPPRGSTQLKDRDVTVFNANPDITDFHPRDFQDDLALPIDAQFLPRPNDRLETPTLKYRYPKSINLNGSDVVNGTEKDEIVVFIDTTREPSTQKPKKTKRPKPTTNKIKKDETEDVEALKDTMTNTMAGASQIGNRESQMVIKPTVIVNVRGTVSHRDSDIRVESRKSEMNDTKLEPPLSNVFNINQEINLERTIPTGDAEAKKVPNRVVQDIKVITENLRPRVEDDMMMCETATWSPQKEVRQERKYDSVLQILFSI